MGSAIWFPRIFKLYSKVITSTRGGGLKLGAAQSGLKLRPPKGGTGVRKWPAKIIGGMGFPKKVLPELPRNEAGLRAPSWAPLQRRIDAFPQSRLARPIHERRAASWFWRDSSLRPGRPPQRSNLLSSPAEPGVYPRKLGSHLASNWNEIVNTCAGSKQGFRCFRIQIEFILLIARSF